MLGGEGGIRVVPHARDIRLRLPLDEVHVGGRQRKHLGVDADAVHVIEAPGDVGHRGGDSEEARAAITDDPLPGGARPEGEVAAASFDAPEVRGRVVMRMEIELHSGSFADARLYDGEGEGRAGRSVELTKEVMVPLV